MARPRKYNWERIEAEVLQSESPIDYKAIEAKYGISREQLHQRAFHHKWKQRHTEFLSELNRLRERQKLDMLVSTYSKLDNAILRIAEALLQQIQELLIDAQKNEPMRPRDVKYLIDGIARLTDMLNTHRGDSANALKELMLDGIIPGELVPQILDILERNDESLTIELNKAFLGRIPSESR